MDKKVGRNDPCPCGSGKKFKNCCMQKGGGKKIQFKAKWINPKESKRPPDLMERTFGDAITKADEKPPLPPKSDN